jgi:hypothetical protein
MAWAEVGVRSLDQLSGGEQMVGKMFPIFGYHGAHPSPREARRSADRSLAAI